MSIIEALPVPEEWMAEASCGQADPDAWFPERGEHVGETAKEICHLCPVESACLRYALANGEKFGVWGGTSERERRRLLRRAS